MQTLNELINEWLIEHEHEAPLFTGMDKAFIGTVGRINMPPVPLYDWHLLVECVMEQGISRYEDAVKYVEFNVAGAYFGEDTPLILNRPDWVEVRVADSTPAEPAGGLPLP